MVLLKKSSGEFMTELIPIGRRCNIHQILALDNEKHFKINSVLDGMVTNPVDGLDVILTGSIDSELVTIDNRIGKIAEKESIKYLHKQWNHKLTTKKTKAELLAPGSNAAYKENICVWVHQDPRSEPYLKKLEITNKSLHQKGKILLYMSNAPSETNKFRFYREEHQQQISNLLKKFADSSGKEIPLLYIDLCLENERSQDISAMGDGLYICRIKVEPLEWYQEKERLDLDLSVNESKIAAIKILQAAQKFAKMCSTSQSRKND